MPPSPTRSVTQAQTALRTLADAWRGSELAFDRLCHRVALLGQVLPDAPLHWFEAGVVRVLASDSATRTTVRIAGVGHDRFRAPLMAYWGGECPLSGITEPALLRASRIKPWKDSTVAERLDVHNGLLLVAHLDSAFDAGLNSFVDDGTMLVSEGLGAVVRGVLGGTGVARFKGLADTHQAYLTWHRMKVVRHA